MVEPRLARAGHPPQATASANPQAFAVIVRRASTRESVSVTAHTGLSAARSNATTADSQSRPPAAGPAPHCVGGPHETTADSITVGHNIL